jgi:hypothetical protein
MYVANQDIKIIENLNPPITPDKNTKEFMVPSDSVILDYRAKQKEWAAKGWKIDMEEVERTQRRVAYAIPSPARRQTKGWVLDPIPLVDGSKFADKGDLKAVGGHT